MDGVDRDLPIQAGDTFPLRETLKAMKLAKEGKDKAHPLGEFKVIIRAHAKLPFHLIEPVLIQCANAGASNVNFNTKKGGSEDAPTAPAP